MKIRQGFVSNSSSASFVIALSILTEKQIEAILDYPGKPYNPEYHCKYGPDYWENIVRDNDRGIISGWTTMDNGDFSTYLDKLGLAGKYILNDDGDR